MHKLLHLYVHIITQVSCFCCGNATTFHFKASEDIALYYLPEFGVFYSPLASSLLPFCILSPRTKVFEASQVSFSN